MLLGGEKGKKMAPVTGRYLIGPDEEKEFKCVKNMRKSVREPEEKL